jgi:hypothetical protein
VPDAAVLQTVIDGTALVVFVLAVAILSEHVFLEGYPVHRLVAFAGAIPLVPLLPRYVGWLAAQPAVVTWVAAVALGLLAVSACQRAVVVPLGRAVEERRHRRRLPSGSPRRWWPSRTPRPRTRTTSGRPTSSPPPSGPWSRPATRSPRRPTAGTATSPDAAPRQAGCSARGAWGALSADRNSFASWRGALRGVVSASQPLGSDNRSTLCQALATCFGIGAAW